MFQMEEKYNVSLLAAGMHREAQLLIAEVTTYSVVIVLFRNIIKFA